jgi:predicted Fe-S protein YdhL (DUF1289 family)
MAGEAKDVESPCVRECVIEPHTGYCRGCFRTLNEISFWANYTPEEKQRVVKHLPARAAQAGGNAAS